MKCRCFFTTKKLLLLSFSSLNFFCNEKWKIFRNCRAQSVFSKKFVIKQKCKKIKTVGNRSRWYAHSIIWRYCKIAKLSVILLKRVLHSLFKRKFVWKMFLIDFWLFVMILIPFWNLSFSYFEVFAEVSKCY